LARLVRKQLQTATNTLLIVTNVGQGFFRFIDIDDLERPRTPK